MSKVVYSINPPRWQRRILIMMTLLAEIAVFMTSLAMIVKIALIATILLGALYEWRRLGFYPIELWVSAQGMACRLPYSEEVGATQSLPSRWYTPIFSEYFIAVNSSRGWWLITRENLSTTALQDLRWRSYSL